jgi:hypothetical protein
VSLPAILPGAACNTEFGAGAPAPSQPGFQPVGPKARIEPPTATEARVRGGGPEPFHAAPADARTQPPAVATPILALVGLVAMGWVVTLGSRRHVRRSARPVRVRRPTKPVMRFARDRRAADPRSHLGRAQTHGRP